jgi:hypothetical protein
MLSRSTVPDRRGSMTASWAKFAVGKPSTRANWTEPACQPLVTVSHVAHVPVAVRIVEDGRLRADLVFDKSKLNTRRIRVVWLSPNDWTNAGGFRYGNIRFGFDWKTLLAGKQAFWVESIAYGVEACRILLSDTDHSSILERYDPGSGDGPWWVDSSGEHFWNGEYCLEVMLEGDVPLSRATHVDFVKHHENRCSIDYKTCKYCGRSADKGAAEFLAVLAGNGLAITLPGLTEDRGQGLVAALGVRGGAVDLWQRLNGLSPAKRGTTKSSDPVASTLGRTMLRALASDTLSPDREALASFFESNAEMTAATLGVLAGALGLPDIASLGDFT